MSETKKKKTGSKKLHFLACFLFCLGLGIIIFALVLSMKGSKHTFGEHPENLKNDSLVCESRNILYPIFTHDHSLKKETKITAIFHDEKIKSLSLFYEMKYGEQSHIISDEVLNHDMMNKSFSSDGYNSEAFNNNFTVSGTSMTMSLFATDSDIGKSSSLKYFFLNDLEYIPKTRSEYQKVYEEKGFSCQTDA